MENQLHHGWQIAVTPTYFSVFVGEIRSAAIFPLKPPLIGDFPLPRLITEKYIRRGILMVNLWYMYGICVGYVWDILGFQAKVGRGLLLETMADSCRNEGTCQDRQYEIKWLLDHWAPDFSSPTTMIIPYPHTNPLRVTMV